MSSRVSQPLQGSALLLHTVLFLLYNSAGLLPLYRSLFLPQTFSPPTARLSRTHCFRGITTSSLPASPLPKSPVRKTLTACSCAQRGGSGPTETPNGSRATVLGNEGPPGMRKPLPLRAHEHRSSQLVSSERHESEHWSRSRDLRLIPSQESCSWFCLAVLCFQVLNSWSYFPS